MALHVVLPAAGVGRRFGGAIPKQYVQILGQTVMAWTLDIWKQINIDGKRIVVCSQEDARAQSVLKDFPGFESIEGGKKRSDSVLNALRYLHKHAHANDWVLVHDIARPCVRTSDISRLIDSCINKGEGAILARKLSDTIKQQKEAGHSVTIDREHLWAALTPQCFRVGELFKALELANQQGVVVTDEASAVENMGLPVHLVEGASDNIKLTQSEDAKLVEFFLTQQKRTINA